MLSAIQIMVAAGMALTGLFFVGLSVYLLGRGVWLWRTGKCSSVFAGRSPLFVLSVHGFALVLLISYYYASRIEPATLVVSRYEHGSQKVAEPVRIALVSDLLWPSAVVSLEEIRKRINALNPQVLLVAGDMVANGGDPKEVGAMLRGVAAGWKMGCVGNHWPEGDREAYEAGGVETLEDRDVFLRGRGWTLHVTGLGRFGTPSDFDHDEKALELLLTHTPERVPEAAAAGFELYLCGHTHGGQVRFPFAPNLFVPGKLGWLYPLGRHYVKDMTVIVTKGIGMLEKRIPRIRFMCNPEICLVEITPAGPPRVERGKEGGETGNDAAGRE
ncbi:MAG: hypothetical protein DRP90_00280 [Planctomycetota bacterium]|nr:MAG: hypothetical protein DRP90_00280 [Planctomycetota bacterium]